jgi:hypothetical protein
MKKTAGILAALIIIIGACKTSGDNIESQVFDGTDDSVAPAYFCRHNGDFRRIIRATPRATDNYKLEAVTDDYGSGDSGRESVIARRNEVNYSRSHPNGGAPYVGRFSAHNLAMTLWFTEGSQLAPSRIEGDRMVLFNAYLASGLRAPFKGSYTCIENGYLALTIQGDDSDGGYAISVNAFDPH